MTKIYKNVSLVVQTLATVNGHYFWVSQIDLHGLKFFLAKGGIWKFISTRPISHGDKCYRKAVLWHLVVFYFWMTSVDKIVLNQFYWW